MGNVVDRARASVQVSWLVVVVALVAGLGDALTLRSSDGVDHVVDVAASAFSHSATLRNLFANDNGDERDSVRIVNAEGRDRRRVVRMPTIASSELQLIVAFINAVAVPEVERAALWIEDGIRASDVGALCRLLSAAHYLDMPALTVAIAYSRRFQAGLVATREIDIPRDALPCVLGLARIGQMARTVSQVAVASEIRRVLVGGSSVTLVNSKPVGGCRNLLHWSIRNDQAMVAQLLLSLPGIDVNVRDESECTPLHEAVRKVRAPGANVTARDAADHSGSRDVVEMLLAVPGIEVNARDQYGRTPLHRAVHRGHRDIVGALLNAPGIEVNAPGENLLAPLHEAVFAPRGADLIDLLLGAPGIDVDARDAYQRTPLHYARHAVHVSVVEALLRAPGIDVNARDMYGATALYRAVATADKRAFELLLGAPGVDVNARSKRQYTPLHFAAAHRCCRVVELLQTAPGIDLDARTASRRTALDIARMKRYREIETLLSGRPASLLERLAACVWDLCLWDSSRWVCCPP
ncbi:Ankyrin repeat domain-containing protein [Plasmodiophora brassicae]